MVYLEIVLETKYIFFPVGMWECSSVVEHSTADREAGISIPLPPFSIIIIMVTCRKFFDVLKKNLYQLVHYFELRRHMNNAFSSYFIVIYDQLLHFFGINCLLTECSLNHLYLFTGGHVGV